MRLSLILSAILGLSALTACKPAAQTETAPAQSTEIKHTDAAQAAKTLAAHPNVTVLDIRTPGEFSQGHIEGAKMIDFKSSDFAENISKLDRNKPYIVHCASGGRSTKSLDIFKDLGFTNVTHLDGGIRGWKAAGLPLTPAN